MKGQSDKPHTYIITVYALDVRLDLKDGFSKDAPEKAMAGHVLAEATLSAKYGNYTIWDRSV